MLPVSKGAMDFDMARSQLGQRSTSEEGRSVGLARAVQNKHPMNRLERDLEDVFSLSGVEYLHSHRKELAAMPVVGKEWWQPDGI